MQTVIDRIEKRNGLHLYNRLRNLNITLMGCVCEDQSGKVVNTDFVVLGVGYNCEPTPKFKLKDRNFQANSEPQVRLTGGLFGRIPQAVNLGKNALMVGPATGKTI